VRLALGPALVLLLVAAELAGSAPRPVLIKMREFAFDPKDVVVKAGEVIFAVKNEGAIEHNFIVEDGARKNMAQIAVLDAGKTEELKVTLRGGTYGIVCTLPGHKDAGMIGTLRVQP